MKTFACYVAIRHNSCKNYATNLDGGVGGKHYEYIANGCCDKRFRKDYSPPLDTPPKTL